MVVMLAHLDVDDRHAVLKTRMRVVGRGGVVLKPQDQRCEGATRRALVFQERTEPRGEIQEGLPFRRIELGG